MVNKRKWKHVACTTTILQEVDKMSKEKERNSYACDNFGKQDGTMIQENATTMKQRHRRMTQRNATTRKWGSTMTMRKWNDYRKWKETKDFDWFETILGKHLHDSRKRDRTHEPRPPNTTTNSCRGWEIKAWWSRSDPNYWPGQPKCDVQRSRHHRGKSHQRQWAAHAQGNVHSHAQSDGCQC